MKDQCLTIGTGWAVGIGIGLLGCDGGVPLHSLDHTTLEDNLANVVEALDMFVGRPWICRDRTDAMVGLSHDIEGSVPSFPTPKHSAVTFANSRDKTGIAGTVGPTRA